MCITKNGIRIQTGDHVRYKPYDIHSYFGGRMPGKVLAGRVSEIFDSMDQTYKCLWIEGERELIREDQLIEKIEEEPACTDAPAPINRICISCARLGMGCMGSTNPVWTGCVHRLPDHLLAVTVTRQQGSNYTPSDLMQSWAAENGGRVYHTHLGGTRLVYRDTIWEYDHWKIVENEDGTENITLHLTAERKQHGTKSDNQ